MPEESKEASTLSKRRSPQPKTKKLRETHSGIVSSFNFTPPFNENRFEIRPLVNRLQTRLWLRRGFVSVSVTNQKLLQAMNEKVQIGFWDLKLNLFSIE